MKGKNNNYHLLAKQCKFVCRYGHIFEKVMRLNMTDSIKQFQFYQLMTILITKHLNMMKMKILIIFYNLKMKTIEEYHGFENEEAS